MILISLILFFALCSLLSFWWLSRSGRKNLSASTPGMGKAGSKALSRKEMNPFGHALLLNQLQKLESEGAFASVIEHFEQTPLPKPRAADELATHVTILQIAGAGYQAQSDWKRAATCYRTALGYSEKIGRNPGELAAGLRFCGRQMKGQPGKKAVQNQAATGLWATFRALL